MDAPARSTDERAPQPLTALVLAAGGPVDPRVARALPGAALVIAADSGLSQARLLGLQPDVLIGDLDSVEPGEVVAVAASGTRVERHPTEKNEIDLELALDAARDAGAARIVLVAGAGGRLDMALGNLLVTALPKYAAVRIEGWVGSGWFAVARPNQPVEILGAARELVSILPLGGPAGGITTVGLRYPLRGESLASGTTRGVSNELTGSRAAVTISSGVALVIRPEALEEP